MLPETRAKRQAKYEYQMLAYKRRDAVLLDMGFANYKAYLASDLWKSIRTKVLERDGGKCHACKRPAKHVHHTDYSLDVMAGARIESLRSLCAGCHKGIEFSTKFGKTTLVQANKRLRRKRKWKAQDSCWENSPEYREIWRKRKELKKQPKTPERAAALKDLAKQRRAIVRAKLNET